MRIIDMNRWCFELGGGHPLLVAQGHAPAPTILQFPTALDVLKYLANDGTWQSEIQSGIDRRLKADSEVKSWHRQRDSLMHLCHFRKYKGKHYDVYHDAARGVVNETATVKQTLMANGLNHEISASKMVVPQGQLLFHGRADQALTATPIYPTFISTSLDPVVAICSALRRSGVRAANGNPLVYVLTVRHPLRAIWGNGGKPHEWEVLLQSGLKCQSPTVHQGSRFDVIEATVGI